MKAKGLNRENILEAIRRGDFVATQGPMGRAYEKDGYCQVESTPVSKMVFYNDSVWCSDRVLTGQGLTRGKGLILPHMTFERVMLEDSLGRRAWLSPIPVNQKGME